MACPAFGNADGVKDMQGDITKTYRTNQSIDPTRRVRSVGKLIA